MTEHDLIPDDLERELEREHRQRVFVDTAVYHGVAREDAERLLRDADGDVDRAEAVLAQTSMPARMWRMATVILRETGLWPINWSD
jgi:hypothetical protein